MYLYGSFVTQRKERATVEIVTHNDRAIALEIGNGSGIYFTADPVEIRSEVNDTFDPLFRSSASVRLLTRDIIPDLFCANVLDAVVNITLDGKCVFAGFLTPRTYSQPYARSYDELELNCIDAISALQFSKYRDIGSLGIDYAAVRESSSIRSFQAVLADIFGKVTKDLDLSWQERCRILYDCSITLGNGHHLFTDIGLSELLFLGEEEDEVWSKLDVAEEIMRYLNLHMVQDGMDFKIYSLDSVKGDSEEIEWKTLTGTQVTGNIRQDVAIATDIAMGTDANISMGEVYNRLELTCEVTEVSDVVESPLNETSVTSPFTNRQKYLTEYVSPFEKRKGDAIDGATSAVDFLNLFTGEKTTGQAFVRDWYMQVEDHLNWKFYDGGNGIDVIATYCTSNSNQQTVPNLMYYNPVAALLSFGSVKKVMDEKDNSLTPKINMETSLIF